MFRPKPEHFNISLKPNELEQLNKVIAAVDPTLKIISKKNKNPMNAPPFTLLKAADGNVYLIGDGIRIHEGIKEKNAYLGKGSHGRVKVAVRLQKENNQYKFSDEIFAVKIIKDVQTDTTSQHYFNLEIYGVGEMLKSEDGSKVYLITPYLPGTPLESLSNEQILSDFKDIMVALAKTMVEFNKKNVIFSDMHSGNCMYDDKNKRITLFDFERCKFSSYQSTVEFNCMRLGKIIDELYQRYTDQVGNPMNKSDFEDNLTTLKSLVIDKFIKNKEQKSVISNDELIILANKVNDLLIEQSAPKLRLNK